MKRRSSETNPKDPSEIRSSSLGGFHGVRSSENRFGLTTSRGTKDINRVKRVKFTDPETDRPPSFRPDASAIPYEGTEAPRPDGPKTSEYAFFKKLKKDAGQTFHSYPLHKEENQSEKFESSDCTGEMTNMVRVRHCFKNLKSSLHVEKNVTPINLDSFPSPLGGPSKNSEMTNMVKHFSKNHKSALIIEKVTPINLDPFPSPFGDPAKNSGTHYWQEAFSTKRQRLRQWVANTSSPGIGELCSKGYDLVSVLLSRLFPESNENNCCRDPKFRQVEIENKSELLAFTESDADFKKLHWTTTSNFMEPEHMPYMDDGSLTCWSNSSKELFLSKLDNVGCDSPSSHAKKSHLQHKLRESDYDLDGGRTARLCTESDSAFGFSFEKNLVLASNHLEELDEFHDPNESALGRQPHTRLLGWNFANMKDEQGQSLPSHNTELSLYPTLPTSGDDQWQSLDNRLSALGRYPHNRLLGWNFDDMKDEQGLSLASHNAELSLYPALPTSAHDDQWQCLDNRFDASGLCLSSFLSNYPPKLTSSPHFHSANNCNLDFETLVLEDEKDLDVALNHFPLTLSCTSYILNPAEDCNYDSTCRGNSIFLSTENHHRFMSKVFSEKCHPSLEALVSSGLDFDLGRKCSAITDTSRELWSSTYHAHQFPQRKGISSYFLPKDEFGSWGETLNQFTNDILNIHDWSSISFQISLDKDKAFPLLLDKSSWDDGETNSDDSDAKYI